MLMIFKKTIFAGVFQIFSWDALLENEFKFMKLFDIYLTIGVFYSLQYRHVAGISSQGAVI